MAEYKVTKTIKNVDELFSQIVVNGETFTSDKVIPTKENTAKENTTTKTQTKPKAVEEIVKEVAVLLGEDVSAVELNGVLHNFSDKELGENLESEVQIREETDTQLQEGLSQLNELITPVQARIEEINTLIPSQASTTNQLADKAYVDSSTNSVQTEIDNINSLIPSQASTTNQLADKDFVNSSIATNTANFINTFNSIAERDTYTTQHSSEFTPNDYCFVATPTETNVLYIRYKWSYNDVSKVYEWKEEYQLNNSGFTAEQWSTINSGITSADKTTWNNKQDKLVSGTNIKTVNGSSILGSGNIEIQSGSDSLKIDGSNGTSAGVSALINKLTTGDSDPTDNDYFVSQYVNGGTTTTTYHRRPIKALWNYIKGKISSILGLTATNYSGKANTAGTADSSNRLNNTNITIQTGSSKQQKISLSTLMSWLITKGYIPSGTACTRVIQTSWSYENNDILQLSANGVNYELQLAGVIIEFNGNATNYNTGIFRLRIHSSPTVSFTSTSGYTKFPVSHIAEYTCNGSGYSPVWNVLTTMSDSAPTGSQTTTSTADSGNNVFTFTLPNGTTKTFTVKNGSKGSTGNTPTITCASGSNINSVGTPSVTASKSGDTVTLTFNYLKGAKGDTGGVTGVKGNSETSYRTGNVNITKANIGLGNVDNTADANKSVKNATTANGYTVADGKVWTALYSPRIIPWDAWNIYTIKNQKDTGFIQLVNGLLIQWGSYAPTSSRKTFPYSYASAPFVFCNYNNNNQGRDYAPMASYVSETEFALRSESNYSSADTFVWIAIGYIV